MFLLRFTNLILLFFSVLVPVLLTYLALGSDTYSNMLALSCGVSAFCLMATNQFLATRPPLIERWMGGLDQLYFAHKWIGISILILISGHNFIGMDLGGDVVTRGTANLAAEVAEFVFPVLVVLLSISFIKRVPKLPFEIPYQFWRFSHRFLGVIFIVLVFHQFFVKAPIETNSVLSTYLQFAALIGVASFLYTQFGAFFRRRRFVVSKVERHPAATIVEATSKGRGIRPKPGNFAFISVGRKGLREPHPFTISQVKDDGTLQFSIRGLGDFTRHLRNAISEGDTIKIEGGYGRFDYTRGGDRQVWVAGGIGVTPFLAFVDTITQSNARDIHLFYCVRNEEEAVGLDRIKAAALRSPKFNFTLFESKRDGRFGADQLIEISSVDPADASFWFCGPSPMRLAIEAGLHKAGKSPKGVHFEKFEFR